jgi:hypothetical protein
MQISCDASRMRGQLAKNRGPAYPCRLPHTCGVVSQAAFAYRHDNIHMLELPKKAAEILQRQPLLGGDGGERVKEHGAKEAIKDPSQDLFLDCTNAITCKELLEGDQIFFRMVIG